MLRKRTVSFLASCQDQKLPPSAADFYYGKGQVFGFPASCQEQKLPPCGGRLLLRQKSAKPFAPDARRRYAPMPCAAGMARAGPNSRIHALEHADLCPAPCCAARRAFRAQEKKKRVLHRSAVPIALWHRTEDQNLAFREPAVRHSFATHRPVETHGF